ncbi:MAG TPA: hypothetical protein VGE50_11265 [Gammaproteobacteria bacterium]
MKRAMANSKTILMGLTLALLLTGCATPSSEEDFGNSVRQMIDAQKYTPPEQKEHSLPRLDGQKGEAAFKQYRTDAVKPQSLTPVMGHGAAPAGQR